MALYSMSKRPRAAEQDAAALCAEQIALIAGAAGGALIPANGEPPVVFGQAPDISTLRRIAQQVLSAPGSGERLGPPLALAAKIRSKSNAALGVLAAFDPQPAAVDDRQRRQAKILAQHVASHFARVEAVERIADLEQQLQDHDERLRAVSVSDPLTGLHNHAALFAETQRMAGDARRSGRLLGVVRAEIDGLERLIVGAGHEAARDAIIGAADALDRLRPSGGVAAKLDCSGFALAGLFDSGQEVADLAEQMRRALDAATQEIRPGQGVRARIGFTATPDPASADAAITDATLALMSAARGADRVRPFAPTLRTASQERDALAGAIRAGLDRGEFFPFFQPQFDASTRKLVAVEALARWRREDGRIDGPGCFLEVAEEMDALKEIDRAIMEQALAARDEWAAMGPTPPRLCLNVTARTLEQPGWVDAVVGLGLPNGALALEIIESVSLERNADRLKPLLERIMAAGVEVEIYDFGSDHASLVGLLTFAPNRLKLDRRLVANAAAPGPSRAMVAGILKVAAEMGVKVTAEGVETETHAEAMRDLGCDLLQGFGLARPMAQDGLLALLQER